MTGLSRKTWFPQVPIALGVALLGLLHLLPVIDQAIGLHLHLRTPGSVRQDLIGIDLSGISQLWISVFLLIMAVGLWLRSRIAWLLSVLTAAVGLANLYLLPKLHKKFSSGRFRHLPYTDVSMPRVQDAQERPASRDTCTSMYVVRNTARIPLLRKIPCESKSLRDHLAPW
jgi:hypothetical protein